MSTPFSQTFIENLNALYGAELREVYKLTIHDDPIVEYRYTNSDEDITYLSEVYTAVRFVIPERSEGSVGSPATVSVTVNNTDQQVTDIYDAYWDAFTEAGLPAPLWTVQIWLVDPDNPDDTPVASAVEYEVEGLDAIDAPAVTFKLTSRYMAQDRLVPKEIYTREEAPFL